ncbi:glycosyltransferase family 2 protein [Polynucleobacter sp. MWH-UH24A]|uniref:glycosyltransferase family 2 protein n=1 Tax=Polynucleobacter sp. MWH-UH24A TaxID=2689110 RepID=UPI001BFE7AE0|nr:glycosyltransferase family 2 protein [Polynucleobacter sp. MWH-UH24A]QWD76428.1 glycosyltransferase family 2 protein [Polynucleobacter sp. MWH-UH24A]
MEIDIQHKFNKYEPFISVIISTYNSQEYITNCLESCFKQTYRNFEVVVCDGASQDLTPYILRNVTHKNFKYIYQNENKGISAARYDAVMLSKGDWVLHLDSDHELLPDSLHELAQEIILINHYPQVGAICGRYIWSDNKYTPKFFPNKDIVNFEEWLLWIEEEGGSDIVFCARKHALLKSNWFFDRRASMDALFHINFSKSWKRKLTNKVFAFQHESIEFSSSRGHRGRAAALSRWSKDMAWQYQSIINVYENTIHQFAPRYLTELYRQAFLHNLYAGNRFLPIKYGYIYITRNPKDIFCLIILMIGLISPAIVRYLNQFQHQMRNYFRVTK